MNSLAQTEIHLIILVVSYAQYHIRVNYKCTSHKLALLLSHWRDLGSGRCRVTTAFFGQFLGHVDICISGRIALLFYRPHLFQSVDRRQDRVKTGVSHIGSLLQSLMSAKSVSQVHDWITHDTAGLVLDELDLCHLVFPCHPWRG